MINNPYDLSDEEIWGKEPTWEEQEIEKLKGKIEQLEEKLEDKECIIKMAKEYIKEHSEQLHHSFDEPDWNYLLYCNRDDLLNILDGKNESQ